MIRVVQINKLFYPWIGGVETVVRQLAEGLAQDTDFQVSVLAGNEKRGLSDVSYPWKGATIHKAASMGIKFSTPISFSYPFLFRKLIAENDVFHFHAPNPMGEFSLWMSSIPRHKKVIVTVHADVQQTRWKFFAPAYNFFFDRLLRRADVITNMGEQNIHCFKSLAPYKNKCVVVPLAYDETHDYEVSDQDKAAFHQQYGLDPHKKTLIFVGRLSYYKGISHLLEAVSQIPEVQLLLVGDGQLKSDIEIQIRNLGVQDRVVMTGFLKGLPLATAYSVSDLFVLPSTTESETFGIVQAEALRFGLPVINTALPTAVPSVSLHNQTGLTIKPGDTPELINAIAQILGDDQLRARFASEAARRSQLFSPARMVSLYKQYYR